MYMTAAGDAILGTAYSFVGMTEQPPNSNLCSPFTDAWGAGAWCAMYVSYCDAATGYPLPPINGPAGFSYCPDGQVYAFSTGHAVGEGGAEPGDTLIFSWEPFYYGDDGIAYCAYGVYAGSPAGDHTGFFAGWLGGGYMRTVEGNTSQSSWDNGGAVMERTDRYTGQICCYARHEAMSGGGPTPGPQPPVDELLEVEMFILAEAVRGLWLMGAGYAKHLDPEEHSQVVGIPGIKTFDCGNNQRAFDVMYNACMNGFGEDTFRMPKVKLIETMGGLHLTDGIHTSHIHSPEDVQHAYNLGWLESMNATWVPDSLANSMIQEAGEPGSDDE
jgi:hypothetical protein